MIQFLRPGRFICLMLLLTMPSFPGWAQVVQKDSVTNGLTTGQEIGRLKAALRYKIRSGEVADSLVMVTRRMAYLPGQVVVLCQLAGFRLQQQQPQQAEALLAEARQLAGQIQNVSEAGWAMSQVGRMQGATRRISPPFSTSLTAVMESLGKSMGVSASMFDRGNHAGPFPIDIHTRLDKRMPDKRSFPPNPTEYLPSLPMPAYDPMLSRQVRIKPDFVDRLIDTLIRSGKSNPKVVTQLTERRKLRDSSQALSKAFAKEGDYAQAYRYFLQYSAYKDSLTAEATSRRLATLAYKQNLLKKEAQIQLLTKDRQLREQDSNRQRQFVLVLTGCVALLIAFSLILTRNNRAKQLANRQLNEQKQALQQTLVELKTTQTQLIHSEKMASLGELTAGIAHEIQNPLNFVTNFSEVSTELVNELMESHQQAHRDETLEQELLTDVQQNLQKIHQHGNRASAIVKGMLEHARMSSGQKEPTDLNALTEEYFKLAYHGIRAKDKSFDAKLTTVLDPGLGLVNVVSQEVGRVLLNVFNNAFYAVQKRRQSHEPDYHPEVAVYTSRESGQVVIRIRDNGTGIPVAIRQKIFQPFFTTKPTGQGTGLGLSLSYDIITKGHGGTFTLDSQEGDFTELIIALPTG